MARGRLIACLICAAFFKSPPLLSSHHQLSFLPSVLRLVPAVFDAILSLLSHSLNNLLPVFIPLPAISTSNMFATAFVSFFALSALAPSVSAVPSHGLVRNVHRSVPTQFKERGYAVDEELLEPYQDYAERYELFSCKDQHNTSYWDSQCSPFAIAIASIANVFMFALTTVSLFGSEIDY